MRGKIWRKLLPKRMPLVRDVDLDELARTDLSGGEIKNVVLNAARIALTRESAGTVTMADLEGAIRYEKGGKWSRTAQMAIGFSR